MKSRKKKLVIVGPVYPYKGGISHYTGLMAAALAKEYDTKVISYSMQYPKILFKKEQRDYKNDSFKFEGTEFLLNTANPFNIIRTAQRINAMKPELVIIQWWHPYFAPCYTILSSIVKAKKLFICHNVFPHERFPLDRFLTKLVLRKGDFHILHSSKEADELKEIIAEPHYRVNMHPTYSAFNFHQAEQKKSDEKVLLFFGFVREYKGLKYMMRAMKELENIKLLIVGDFGGKREEYDNLSHELGIEDKIEIHDGYTPDREVEKYFAASDAVVLPYIDATQSGIAQIAFGFEKPVIATRVGGLTEVVTDGKTGILSDPANPGALAEAVRRFYELKESGTDFKANIRSDSERFSWEHMVKTIKELTGV